MAENGLQIFEIGGMKCYEKDGMAYLELEAVARGLGFTQEKKNGIEYVRWETVRSYLEKYGFPSEMGKDDYIPENIFYRLAMKAKNETAEKFQAFVADEVIPSIRKHGGYLVGQDQMSPEELLSRAVLFANSKIKELETQIEAERPKVEFANKVIADDNLIDMNTFAKLIEEKKILSNGKLAFIGRNGLFALLGGMNIFQKKNRNLPLQKYINQGYFVVKYPQDHDSKTYPKTYITGKGQVWLTKKLKEYCELHNVG